MYEQLLLATLLFMNIIVLVSIILIGGAIMDAINQAVMALNAAVTALQARLGNGVLVQQADLVATAASINQVATVINSIAV